MKKKIKRIVLIVLASVLGISLIWFAFLYWGAYSNGWRAGMVVKVSKKGTVFKTYEGELNTSEMDKWAFSVESDEEEVLKILNEVALTKERVKLHYVERYRTFIWRGDTKYFVTQVERIEKEEGGTGSSE